MLFYPSFFPNQRFAALLLPRPEMDNVYIIQFKKKFPQYPVFSGRRALARTGQRETGDRRNGRHRFGKRGPWTTARVISWSHFSEDGVGTPCCSFAMPANLLPQGLCTGFLSIWTSQISAQLTPYLLYAFAPKGSCQWKPPLTSPLGTIIPSPAVTISSPRFPVPRSA